VKTFGGRDAAVTGAASGIGRALARDLAGRGAHLALADIDAAGLAETARRCQRPGLTITSQHLDVADRDAVYAWADQVVADHGRVNLIFNNAGVGLAASVEAMSYADFEWLMSINFWGVVYGTKAFLPHLKAAGEGHVVNLSSVFGLISVPGQAAYNAAKFGIRGFTDALRMELEMERCGVSCTTVHPGGVKTNIARNARLDPGLRAGGPASVDPAAEFDKLARTTPESAARQILLGVAREHLRGLADDAREVRRGVDHRVPVAASQRLQPAVAVAVEHLGAPGPEVAVRLAARERRHLVVACEPGFDDRPAERLDDESQSPERALDAAPTPTRTP